jgi:hypothetical protein
MWPHSARWLMPLALGILVTPLAAHAQLAGKVPRIGLVGNAYAAQTWGGAGPSGAPSARWKGSLSSWSPAASWGSMPSSRMAWPSASV